MSRYQHSGRTDQAKAGVKRLHDALRLQNEERWRGAMYLAGYSIECKLKARLMEMYGINTLQDLEAELERRIGGTPNVFSHSIEVLFGLTGVRDRLLKDPKRPTALRSYHRCNTWKPAWRYDPSDGSRDECASFLAAVEEFGQFIDGNV